MKFYHVKEINEGKQMKAYFANAGILNYFQSIM